MPQLGILSGKEEERKKVMKTKRVSIVDKGMYAKASVFSRRKQKTATGMTKDGLMTNKSGRWCRRRLRCTGRNSTRRMA